MLKHLGLNRKTILICDKQAQLFYTNKITEQSP